MSSVDLTATLGIIGAVLAVGGIGVSVWIFRRSRAARVVLTSQAVVGYEGLADVQFWVTNTGGGSAWDVKVSVVVGGVELASVTLQPLQPGGDPVEVWLRGLPREIVGGEDTFPFRATWRDANGRHETGGRAPGGRLKQPESL